LFHIDFHKKATASGCCVRFFSYRLGRLPKTWMGRRKARQIISFPAAHFTANCGFWETAFGAKLR
jgi:hypothetical protein